MAALQLAQPSSSKEGEDGAAGKSTAPSLDAQGAQFGTPPSTAPLPHGSVAHNDVHLPRGLLAASFLTPPPLPATGQLNFPSPSSLPSPFAHASELIAGLGQAHPSTVFPNFSEENPWLWKTLCEQYFQMFGIHSSFWVSMATLNFSGSASIWL